MIDAAAGQSPGSLPAGAASCSPSPSLAALQLCERPSAAARQLRERLGAVARSPATVVSLWGPAGAGKRSWARWLHQQATVRAQQPLSWSELHCGALRAKNAHAALFGARHGPPGALAKARGGTLFLREVCRLPSTVQATLACVLEAQASAPPQQDTPPWRTVTSCRLHPAVQLERGQLRQDLYDQLSVFCQPVPALADSRDDIAPLAHFFVRRLSQARNLPYRPLAEDALEALGGLPLRGNIRELRGIIERALVVAVGPRLCAEDLTTLTAPPSRPQDVFFCVDLDPAARPYPVDQVVRRYVARVLEHLDYQRGSAAKTLGMSYPTFLKRLRELNLHEGG